MPNISQMMGMAQDMARRMEEEMDALTVEGNAGGGMVTVSMDGHKRLKSLRIDPEAVDPADVEMLQDLVLAAVNDARAKVEEKLKSSLGGMTGGLPFGAL
ncbi:MAG: YbaB/EbfC family nucleoid-associated protein [Candidatus Aminicenantes bacterium]|nr:YbaB/EbfC family nucleoid-associated protein [Candidatus Aminicenantes bacterium]